MDKCPSLSDTILQRKFRLRLVTRTVTLPLIIVFGNFDSHVQLGVIKRVWSVVQAALCRRVLGKVLTYGAKHQIPLGRRYPRMRSVAPGSFGSSSSTVLSCWLSTGILVRTSGSISTATIGFSRAHAAPSS